MKVLVAALAACLLLASAPVALAQKISASEQRLVDRAAQRGQQLFDFDRAAWVSTDAIKVSDAKARQSEVRGYIVETRGDGQSVLYYGMDGAKPYGVFIVDVRNGAVTTVSEVKTDGPRDVTPVQNRMIGARNMVRSVATVKDSPFKGCANAPMNTVVIPPATPVDPVDVYILTPQVKTGVYPAGGHYKVTILADGSPKDTRPFMKSCMDLGALPDAKGNLPAAVMLSHLLDPVPTEIHVFLSLASKLPVYVMIQDTGQLWTVNGARISKAAR